VGEAGAFDCAFEAEAFPARDAVIQRQEAVRLVACSTNLRRRLRNLAARQQNLCEVEAGACSEFDRIGIARLGCEQLVTDRDGLAQMLGSLASLAA